MSEAGYIFNARKKEAHIQFEEMNKFIKLCEEGKAISGISEKEEKELISELEKDVVNYSNDMVVDMIIDYVIKTTEDERLFEILQNIRIANIDEDNITGRSYPKYYDGSYYIEISRKMDRQIRLLSDFFAVFYMSNKNLTFIENLILDELLNVNLQRFNSDTDNTEEYNEVQIHMMCCEKLLESDFTEKYIAYAREINEMALAFLVGHEIGHHYLGHTDYDNANKEDDKIKELKADEYGIEFAFEYLKSAYPNDESRYGIHHLAAVYIPLIVSVHFCNNIFEEGEKHPSIIKRLIGVQIKLKKMLDEDGFYNVQKAIGKLYNMFGISNHASK